MEKIKILIVEDEIFIARDLQMSLEKMGITVISIVPSGEQAIQKVGEERPDIVLMDIVLQGGMDGIETAGIIRSNFDIPVIYLTAHGDKAIFERAKATEPFGYLIKPFKDEDLRRTIDIALYKHRTERLLIEKAREIEVINKELKDFIYIISHDLKAPLFTIAGYASNLSGGYKDKLDEKGRNYIDRIKVNVETMSKRVYELIEVMKAGQAKYDFKNNDSSDIVTNVVRELNDEIKNNRIETIIQDDLPHVLCDEKRLRDVFSNLITNAIKFMGEGEQRQISIGYDKEGDDYHKFYVEDTGIGIREEYQEQIFTIFRRLKDVEAEGTGVGLTMVKKIVEQHKGNMWIESPVKDERGSRFCFTIPISRKITARQDIQSSR